VSVNTFVGTCSSTMEDCIKRILGLWFSKTPQPNLRFSSFFFLSGTCFSFFLILCANQILVASMKGFAVNIPNIYVSSINTAQDLVEFFERKFGEQKPEAFPGNLPPNVVLQLDPPPKINTKLPKYLAQFVNN